MKVTIDIKKGTLVYDQDNQSYEMGITCSVRTLANGRRTTAVKDVVHAIPSGLPYDPMQFPKGKWKITAVEWNTQGGGKDKFNRWEYGNVKIRTDAKQLVNTWELDADGNYLRPTGKQVWDSGYLIHYSTSKTTLGCIRADQQIDIDMLACICEDALNKQGVGSTSYIDLEVI